MKIGNELVKRVRNECKTVYVYTNVCTPLFKQWTHAGKKKEPYLYLKRHIWAISIAYMFLSCPILKAECTIKKY